MSKTAPPFLPLTESQRLAIDEAGATLDRLKAEVQRRVQVAFVECCAIAKLDPARYKGTLDTRDGRAGFVTEPLP